MFRLSNIASADVKKSQFDSSSYLHLERGKRSVNLSMASWQKLKSLVPKIDEAVNDGTSLRQDLYNTWSTSQAVTVDSFQDKMYVGIHFFGPDGERQTGKGLNVTADEWAVLTTLPNDLSGFPEAWQYPDSKRTVFQWVKRENGRVVAEGRPWFCLDDCYKDAVREPGLNPCGFTMREKEVTLPSAEELLKMCYSWMVQKAAHALVKCNGCDIDHPSQTQHLDGCLMSQENVILLYEREARENTDMDKLFKMYSFCREELCLPVKQEEPLEVARFVQDVPLICDIDPLYTTMFEKC
jgi:hypothetical protein